MKMLIGLTGRTGSGKTSAAKIFEKSGAFVVDCDSVAHDILKDAAVKEKIVAQFSESILDSNNNIDRKALGAIVFSDDKKLSLLNKIVHGAIVDTAIDLCEKSGNDICVIDGSELETSGADKKCAHIVVITADEETRLKRITMRDKIDRDSALLRMRAQKDYSKDAILIDNSMGQDALESEITKLYNKFLGEINA